MSNHILPDHIRKLYDYRIYVSPIKFDPTFFDTYDHHKEKLIQDKQNIVNKKCQRVKSKIFKILDNEINSFNSLLIETNIISYLFYNDPLPVVYLKDLFYKHFVNQNNRIYIQLTPESYETAIKCLDNYKSAYNLYLDLNTNVLPYLSFPLHFKKNINPCASRPPTIGEKKVIDCLDLLAGTYVLYYFHNYSLVFTKNKNLLVYDFFCIFIHDFKMYIFVIEFDGDQHIHRHSFFHLTEDEFRKSHIRDILKQYYLEQMNIHLLRISLDDDIPQSITNFINRIIKEKTYIAVNKIVPIEKYFEKSHAFHPGLSHFYKTHEKYHRKYIDQINSLQFKTKIASAKANIIWQDDF